MIFLGLFLWAVLSLTGGCIFGLKGLVEFYLVRKKKQKFSYTTVKSFPRESSGRKKKRKWFAEEGMGLGIESDEEVIYRTGRHPR